MGMLTPSNKEPTMTQSEALTFAAFGFVLFGIPAIIARLLVKWGIY